MNKNYRYRVSLTYYNANHLVDPKFVEEPSETRLELSTAPSRPSNTVTLPPIRAVLAGGETSINRRSEVPPKSKLWFWQLDTQRGGEVAKDFPEITVGDLVGARRHGQRDSQSTLGTLGKT